MSLSTNVASWVSAWPDWLLWQVAGAVSRPVSHLAEMLQSYPYRLLYLAWAGHIRC